MRAYGETTLPPEIRSCFVANGNGLNMHVLEAGEAGRPCLLLLHGFPELAYSWRKVMVPLAMAGFHVIAPDQRGYGHTTGADTSYDGDLRPYNMLNLAHDAVGLLAALGIREAVAVAGHDFGSSVAAWCALLRPDLFRSVALMSAPFSGPPSLPFDKAGRALSDADTLPAVTRITPALAALTPPRKHYHAYYGTRDADTDMRKCPQGLHAFLRAYYHQKSGDWPGNTPYLLAAWTAGELAKLPDYYVMPRDKNMAEAVAPAMPSSDQIAACRWLTEAEMAVYAREYARTGFQGGLNWYRARLVAHLICEHELFAGRTIDVPACFFAGASDWGIHQTPGALAAMATRACTQYRGTHLIAGGGHWVQQEQPEEVTRLLLSFLRT